MTDLTAQITAALKEYSTTCEQEIQKAIDDVSKEAKRKLLSTSPKGGRSQYRKGWKVTVERRSGYYKAHIHNKEYQLTHLLEHGHKTVLKSGKYGDKSSASARPHIAAVEQWANKEIEKRIREVLSG